HQFVTLSLPDALPISLAGDCRDLAQKSAHHVNGGGTMQLSVSHCSTRFGPSWAALVSCLGTRRRPCTGGPGFLSSGIRDPRPRRDRKSTRLNSSHVSI